MRTTLTLDDDVAVAVRRRAKETGSAFKRVVNEVLRAGLVVIGEREATEPPRVAVRTYQLGKPRIESLDNIAEVLAHAEGEDFR